MNRAVPPGHTGWLRGHAALARRSLNAVIAIWVISACGAGAAALDDGTPPRHKVITVPAQAPTISAGVARARPGDIVLVSPGIYAETVTIATPRVTVRGLDRATVVVDGGVIRPNGIVLTAPGVAVQNLTVRHTLLNGILITGETDAGGSGVGRGSDGYTPLDTGRFPPLQGFLVDHVTSYDNGLYGIYAFDTQHGVIEASYTSGMADSGLYVGQCKPCDIAVRDNVAEFNAVGYEGTNASDGVYVYRNRFVGNRVGATSASDHLEALLPQTGAEMVGNLIAANDQAATPTQAEGGFGIGLGIAGGTHNTVDRNLIEANPAAGVVLTNTDDLAPIGNRLVGNVFDDNGVDVAYTASAAAPGTGNCLQGNVLHTVLPDGFPTSCAGSPAPVAAARPTFATAPAGIAFTDVIAPPPLPSMADPQGAPAPGTIALPGPVDLDLIPVPAPDLLADQSRTRW